MNRCLWLVALMGFALGACDRQPTTVILDVTSTPGVPPLTDLRLVLGLPDGDEDYLIYPIAAEPTPLPIDKVVSVGVVLDLKVPTALDIVVEGWQKAAPMASGEGQATVTPGRVVHVPIQLRAGAPPCGNGVLDPGEECDDGNRRKDDACDLHCRIVPTEEDAGIDAARDRAGDVGDAGGGNDSADKVTDTFDALADTKSDAPDAPVEMSIDAAIEAGPDGPDAPVDMKPDVTDAPPEATKLANGAPCSMPAQCSSGFCANGVCCNTACNDCGGMVCTCYACNLFSKIGTCSFACTGSQTCSSSCGFPMRCCP